ncbi:MAG: hypothetical protein LBM92_07065 [Opitutaceae bacterium]|jgi:hypothetical protein|nr:hypothetical protein [Opitutaceae bacterium]
MCAFQRDYILRLIEQLREFLAEITRLRETGNSEQALNAIIRAQERLFTRPAGEFLPLPPDAQFRLLTRGEPPSDARAKCLAQADLLVETARVYLDKDQPAIASGAWQFALRILEQAAALAPAETGAGAEITSRIIVARAEIQRLETRA